MSSIYRALAAQSDEDTEGYAWQIDVDHIKDPEKPEGTFCNAKGVQGPSEATDELLARLTKGEGRKFKCYDDDGELYYTGRIVFANPEYEQSTPDDTSDILPEEAFGPLNDFALPNAGAVCIKYRNPQGEWKVL